MKNMKVVPAYSLFDNPSGSRYMATGGPPEWAIIEPIPEATPAATPFALDRG